MADLAGKTMDILVVWKSDRIERVTEPDAGRRSGDAQAER
jgi:hypothetical protein